MLVDSEISASVDPPEQYPELTDQDVIRKVLAGDRPLFAVLMRRHNRKLYRAIRGVLRDEAEVEEAMQQAYLEAFRHLQQFRGDARFSTWLLKIGLNEARARNRRRPRLVPLDLETRSKSEVVVQGVESEQPTPEEQLGDREVQHLAEAAVDGLAPLYKSALILREIEGLSTSETAEVLEVSEDVVKQRLHRAKQAVREALGALLGGELRNAFPFHAPRCDRLAAAVLAQIAGEATQLSGTADPKDSNSPS